ncbi:MAG: hypothetical protein H6868_04875 [Rhodospirillales bacterium]|nr:hypothetical protein [Rhodospirillales bacterium]
MAILTQDSGFLSQLNFWLRSDDEYNPPPYDKGDLAMLPHDDWAFLIARTSKELLKTARRRTEKDMYNSCDQPNPVRVFSLLWMLTHCHEPSDALIEALEDREQKFLSALQKPRHRPLLRIFKECNRMTVDERKAALSGTAHLYHEANRGDKIAPLSLAYKFTTAIPAPASFKRGENDDDDWVDERYKECGLILHGASAFISNSYDESQTILHNRKNVSCRRPDTRALYETPLLEVTHALLFELSTAFKKGEIKAGDPLYNDARILRALETQQGYIPYSTIWLKLYQSQFHERLACRASHQISQNVLELAA